MSDINNNNNNNNNSEVLLGAIIHRPKPGKKKSQKIRKVEGRILYGRWVFSACLKKVKLGMCQIPHGSSFQMRGPATEKAL